MAALVAWPPNAPLRMKVTLRWCTSGNVFDEVVCDAEPWGTIIRGDHKAWSYVPTRKLNVVRADAIIPSEGLFLAAAAEVSLPIYAKPAIFHNALAGLEALPDGERKWRKEFRQHVAETYYRTPPALASRCASSRLLDLTHAPTVGTRDTDQVSP